MKQCHFLKISNIAIRAIVYENYYYIDFKIEDIVLDNINVLSPINFVSIMLNGNVSSTDGIISITHCQIRNSAFDECISAASVHDQQSYSSNLMIRCSNNTFIDNHIVHGIYSFKNWPYLEIDNSVFINNTATYFLISIAYSYIYSYTPNVFIHDLLITSNQIETDPGLQLIKEQLWQYKIMGYSPLKLLFLM